ncbi:MAG: sarcosine oxidase subunit gamma family protein [Pseudomonadota bacterium]
MVKLIASDPVAGMTVLEGDGVRVTPQPWVPLTSLASKGPGLSKALKAAHGVDVPAAGQMSAAGAARCLWFSATHFLLVGPEPDAKLSKTAALTDQSDAWVRVLIEGPRAAEMLAYLTPIDLRDGAFPVGSVARSLIGHMNAAIARTGGEAYEVFAFRSMAQTLMHEMDEALRALP